MKRIDLISSPEYWITKIQIALYNCVYKFMENSHKNKTQLAEHLGVSKGYVTQLLNGDYDHKLSKLVSLSLEVGYIPVIDFVPIDEYCQKEKEYIVSLKALCHIESSMELSEFKYAA